MFLHNPLHSAVVLDIALALSVDGSEREPHDSCGDDGTRNEANGNSITQAVVRLLSGKVDVGPNEASCVAESCDRECSLASSP